MPRSTVTLFTLAVMALASGAMGCSSTSSGSGGNSGSSSGGSCASATVSFKTDVIPLIQNSCSLTSSCHGMPNYTMAESLYLGPNLSDQPSGDTASDIQTAHDNLVNVTAVESTMKFVVPGDLANSFLWHKINGDVAPPNGNNAGKTDPMIAATCMAAAASTTSCVDCNSTDPCGTSMPYLGELLTSDEQCVFQNWILGGALNN